MAKGNGSTQQQSTGPDKTAAFFAEMREMREKVVAEEKLTGEAAVKAKIKVAKKPPKFAWLRVNPDPDYKREMDLVLHDGHFYNVHPSLRRDLRGSVQEYEIVVAVDDKGEAFLWALPGFYARVNEATEPLRDAATQSADVWTRVEWTWEGGGSYLVFEAEEDLGLPEYPKETLDELLAWAFDGRTIESADHRIYKLIKGRRR